MASVESTEVEIVEVRKEPGFVLHLTRDEVFAMLAVFAKVGGDPDYSPRKHIADITFKFHEAGMYYGNGQAYALLKVLERGALHFNNYPNTEG